MHKVLTLAVALCWNVTNVLCMLTDCEQDLLLIQLSGQPK